VLGAVSKAQLSAVTTKQAAPWPPSASNCRPCLLLQSPADDSQPSATTSSRTPSAFDRALQQLLSSADQLSGATAAFTDLLSPAEAEDAGAEEEAAAKQQGLPGSPHMPGMAALVSQQVGPQSDSASVTLSGPTAKSLGTHSSSTEEAARSTWLPCPFCTCCLCCVAATVTTSAPSPCSERPHCC
jgi:hypothetical protein